MSSDSDDNGDNEIENGHLPLEEPPSPTENAQFDIDLPTSHRYLGKLTNISNYVFYEDGEIVTLAAIQTKTLVFPGFTLPLVLNSEIVINMLQRHTRQKNAFVLLTPTRNFDGIFQYGFVMEIYETHLLHDVLHLKARSRQRCKLVSRNGIKTLVGDLYQVTVKVSLEPLPNSPISNTQLVSLRNKRAITCDKYEDFDRVLRKNRKYHLTQYPLASWVYDKHEICFLVKQMFLGLADYHLVQYIPQDAVQFSYWFVQNFQLRHEERLRILMADSTVERLRLELNYLRMRRLIVCSRCGAEIAQPKDVFQMSKDGIQSNYCNPGGFVYETVTVSRATNIELVGTTSSQFSWFPGYSWTIMQCKQCFLHVGWKFTSANLKPNNFYGLAKSGLDVQIVRSRDEEWEGGE